MYSCLVSLSLYHFPVVCRKLMAEKHKKMETMRNKRGVWAWTKEYLLEERLPSVVFNWAGFCPGKLKAAMKTTPEIMLAVLWNTVGCLCALQYRIHLVQNSADRALQALFRLSSSKVGSTNDDIGVLSLSCITVHILWPEQSLHHIKHLIENKHSCCKTQYNKEMYFFGPCVCTSSFRHEAERKKENN